VTVTFIVLLAAAVSNAALQEHRIQLKTIAGEKTVVRNGTAVRKVPAASSDAQIRSNEYVVARWAEKEEKIAPIATKDGTAWSVGFGFIAVRPDGQEIRFRPIIESVGGLSLSGSTNRFQGRIYVGLRDNKNPDAAYPLSQPISLLVGGQAEELQPRQLTIDHTNLPFAEVSIASQDPPDPIDFSLIAAGTSERAMVSLPIIRPRLSVLPGRSRIQGLGLETAVISVRAVGLMNPEGRIVTVTSDVASVDPVEVRLDQQGVGTTSVRSVSVGEASINAVSPPLAPAKETIHFSWPIAYFLASVVGGLAGASLAWAQKKGKKKKFQTVLIRGTLTGIIVVALYAVGVNVLPIQPTATAGEVLAFAVAAAGGFVGLKF
jgi:hypothetical protein